MPRSAPARARSRMAHHPTPPAIVTPGVFPCSTNNVIPVSGSGDLSQSPQLLCGNNFSFSTAPANVSVDMMHIGGDVFASACNATKVEQNMVARAVVITCASGKKIYVDTTGENNK